MKVSIVTTTINKPTKALLKYARIAEERKWEFIIVGDKKTPHDAYLELISRGHRYLHPKYQHQAFPELSSLIGWNCIQRRNFGFIMAYISGADVIATIDDDNIPDDDWGKNLLIGKKANVDYYETDLPAFDPLGVFEGNDAWHRGFPIELIKDRNQFLWGSNKTKKKILPLVQADLWEGDPDIDAICRIANPNLNIHFPPKLKPYASNKISPFNSQNTFLSHKLFPTYFLFPHIGRMDDIWASYITQYYFPGCVVYNKPSVVQERNEHNLVTDLEQEMIGYKNNLELINNLDVWEQFLPKESLRAYKLYRFIINGHK